MAEKIAKTSFAILVLVFVSVAADKHATPRKYETAKILKIERKVNTKVLYYVVNTPITKDEPYYEISVQLKDEAYMGKYIPRHADEELPEEWTDGASVEARVDSHHLYLKRPSGMEMDLYVAKHTAAKDDSPGPAKN